MVSRDRARAEQTTNPSPRRCQTPRNASQIPYYTRLTPTSLTVPLKTAHPAQQSPTHSLPLSEPAADRVNAL